MANTQDFNGKWALVTGASAGIGIALARELASHGAKLILTARRKDRLDSFAAELTGKGTEVRIVAADLNDPAAPRQIYDATEAAGLPVEILINNAGLGQFGAFVTNNPDQEFSAGRTKKSVNRVGCSGSGDVWGPPALKLSPAKLGRLSPYRKCGP